jgi:hypothetical protein
MQKISFAGVHELILTMLALADLSHGHNNAK